MLTGVFGFPAAVKPQLPADFEAATWRKLSAAVAAVHEKTPVATSLEELYRVSVYSSVHRPISHGCQRFASLDNT